MPTSGFVLLPVRLSICFVVVLHTPQELRHTQQKNTRRGQPQVEVERCRCLPVHMSRSWSSTAPASRPQPAGPCQHPRAGREPEAGEQDAQQQQQPSSGMPFQRRGEKNLQT